MVLLKLIELGGMKLRLSILLWRTCKNNLINLDKDEKKNGNSDEQIRDEELANENASKKPSPTLAKKEKKGKKNPRGKEK